MEWNERKGVAEPFDWADAEGGIRKTAIFLSILDEKIAGEMLARLEPEIARAVGAELKRVGELSAAEVESVVSEFLALNGENCGESGAKAEISQNRSDFNAIFDAANGESDDEVWNDWRRNAGIGKKNGKDGCGELRGTGDLPASDDDFQALDAFEPETLAEILRDESAGAIAVVASRLSAERRVETLKLLPLEAADDATRLATALERRTETAQFLEDAVFHRAF